jgi:hypothetical protein
MGRPSGFSIELADRICAEIAAGHALVTVCETNDWAPGASTAFMWLNKYPEFLERYTHARDVQQELYASQVIHIADTVKDAAVARNMIDARKWYAGKVAPKKWGDKVEIDAKVEVTSAPTENLMAFLAMAETNGKKGN